MLWPNGLHVLLVGLLSTSLVTNIVSGGLDRLELVVVAIVDSSLVVRV